MRKKKYIVNCPCSGKQLCKVSDGSEIEIKCKECNGVFSINCEGNVITIKILKEPNHIKNDDDSKNKK